VRARTLLESCRRILLVDWPSREVPEALVRAGYTVYVKSGPGPDDYTAQELREGRVVGRLGVSRPTAADLVYMYRPVDELPSIISLARELGATALWRQSGLRSDGAKDPRGCWVPEDERDQARQLVESAGLIYIDDPYIVDVARTAGLP
jgi:predicted CoA-binding protein